MADPVIILVSEHHADTLLEVFYRRYGHDYSLRSARSCTEAEKLAQELKDAGESVALFVSDSRLPDVEQMLEAVHRFRIVVPTARRVIAAHWDYFLMDAEELRPGLAQGKYDAYLLMPRGNRDEEFHNAITELLSDWTSTVPQPEVVSAKVISPVHDGLTMAIRDFLDRMGMQNSVYDPNDPHLQEFMPALFEELGTDEPRYPVVWSPARGAIQATSVRDVARSIYPRTEEQADEVVDLAVVGAGPAGLAAAVYAASEGLTRPRARGGGGGRPGRHQLDDPQLPRLPAWHLRHAAGAAGAQPGDPVRHQVPHRLGGHRARGRRGRRAARAAL